MAAQPLPWCERKRRMILLEGMRLPERKPLRWNHWNYEWPGFYFVTICVKNMAHVFGHVYKEEMVYSPIGNAAVKCWKEIPKHFPFVILDEFIVMPNHVHGIIQISDAGGVGAQNFAPVRYAHPSRMIGLIRGLNPSIQYRNSFSPQSQNLGSIIRGFKVGVMKYAKENDIQFAWHRSFNDKVIRDEWALHNIRKYIRNNPKNWGKKKILV